MHLCVRVCARVCMPSCVCMYVCMSMCVFVEPSKVAPGKCMINSGLHQIEGSSLYSVCVGVYACV